MGEHKLREANGDGEKPKKISSHIVEVVHEYADTPRLVAESLEAAYTKLSTRAEEENSLILGVVQSMNTYRIGERGYVFITVTAQRISREDFERQQRMAQFSGGPRR